MSAPLRFLRIACLVASACGAPAQPDPDVVAVPPPPPREEPAVSEADPPPPEPSPESSPRLGPLNAARVENARVEAMSIAMAVELWQSSRPDQCPRYDELVADKVLPPDKPNQDPWGQPYSIQCTEAGASVVSNGPDEMPGTADDVTGSNS